MFARKSEVLPLLCVVGAALTAGGVTIVRKLTLDPDVEFLHKEDRVNPLIPSEREEKMAKAYADSAHDFRNTLRKIYKYCPSNIVGLKAFVPPGIPGFQTKHNERFHYINKNDKEAVNERLDVIAIRKGYMPGLIERKKPEESSFQPVIAYADNQ